MENIIVTLTLLQPFQQTAQRLINKNTSLQNTGKASSVLSHISKTMNSDWTLGQVREVDIS